MASFVARSSFCLLVAFFCFTLGVEAREGKLFFSKFTHLGANKEVGPSPKPAPVSPAPAPGPAQVGGPLGDGHFGPGSGMVPQTKESWPVSSTTSDEEFDKLMEKFDSEKGYGKTDKSEAENYDTDKLTEDFEEEEDSEDPREQTGKYINHNNNHNNEHNDDDDDDDNGYNYSTTSNYKSNNHDGNVKGYGEERQGMSDTRFMENGKYFYDVKGQNYEGNNKYREERQGMSDTRFMENGNYFDDENSPNRYESSGGAHANEFDSMEEYYKSLEGSSEGSMP